ncbi:uncharacterized protein BXZ73DRAFT_78927 [Epithele typhae]|uniref:uncharacterized protein n=1 Tax=Epithele typhae TaxID=378194 RepID=UPI0020089AA4|nr:uncharacterized protein BXZ73DRAFT_78927 [Epithele typhae]KAH9925955.1 hypothetical protein BXZ73DRAFT_78927 [Epithele typhae]
MVPLTSSISATWHSARGSDFIKIISQILDARVGNYICMYRPDMLQSRPPGLTQLSTSGCGVEMEHSTQLGTDVVNTSGSGEPHVRTRSTNDEMDRKPSPGSVHARTYGDALSTCRPLPPCSAGHQYGEIQTRSKQCIQTIPRAEQSARSLQSHPSQLPPGGEGGGSRRCGNRLSTKKAKGMLASALRPFLQSTLRTRSSGHADTEAARETSLKSTIGKIDILRVEWNIVIVVVGGLKDKAFYAVCYRCQTSKSVGRGNPEPPRVLDRELQVTKGGWSRDFQKLADGSRPVTGKGYVEVFQGAEPSMKRLVIERRCVPPKWIIDAKIEGDILQSNREQGGNDGEREPNIESSQTNETREDGPVTVVTGGKEFPTN